MSAAKSAASATEAALRGRQDEFAAAAATLDGNSQDLAATIGAVYGDAAEAAFVPFAEALDRVDWSETRRILNLARERFASEGR